MRKLFIATLVTLGIVGYEATAFAYELPCDTGVTGDCDVVKQDELKDGSGQVRSIINVLMMLLGAIAVIVIIYGGFLYVTSRGDAGKVTAAKNTILYAVIGIIVALLAYAIVRFVVDRFGATSTTSNTTNTSTTQ